MFKFIEDFIGIRTVYGTRIGFIGLGKLGLPCAEAIRKKGFSVVGFDTKSISSNLIEIKKTQQEVVENSDIIFIATPTPHEQGYDGREPTKDKTPKNFIYDHVKNVLLNLNQINNKNKIIVLISTVLPGTIRKELDPILEQNKLIYNPYLIGMGTVETDFYNPEMIMLGGDNSIEAESKIEILQNFYNQVCDNYPRIEKGTWEEIESIKIFYNTFITTKITFVNMIQDVANKIKNMNVDKVTRALAKSTKRIVSPAYMVAGMGDGGACHPRDNIALRWLSNDLNLGYDYFENVIHSREKQAENMAREILKYGQKIYFTSDSYKANTDLVDGSYSLLVQHYVKQLNGHVEKDCKKPFDVAVIVHKDDTVPKNENSIIFDPWRTYPKDNNVVYYGK